jgi:hypothetical protein
VLTVEPSKSCLTHDAANDTNTKGDDVSYMLTSYVDKLKEKAKYARALLDYKVDDESLLSFEKGAIINIIERSIDGWCLGEVQGKQGMFPVAMTEFILTDSADLSLIPMQPHSERRKKASGSTMRAGPIPVPEETKTSSKKKKVLVTVCRVCVCVCVVVSGCEWRAR